MRTEPTPITSAEAAGLCWSVAASAETMGGRLGHKGTALPLAMLLLWAGTMCWTLAGVGLCRLPDVQGTGPGQRGMDVLSLDQCPLRGVFKAAFVAGVAQ